MARDFSKNTSNNVACGTGAIGAAFHGATALSGHAIVTGDAFDVANNHIFAVDIGSGNVGFSLDVNGNASNVLRAAARSVSGDTARVLNGATTLSTGTEYSVGMVVTYQIGAGNLRVYLNGAQDGSGISGTMSNGNWNDGAQGVADRIGAGLSLATTTQWDGRIAEVAFWTVDIGTAGFAQLAARVPALLVRPQNLVFYARLSESGGIFNLMSDTAVGACTINGTVAVAAHPRMYAAASPFVSVSAGGPPPADITWLRVSR